MNNIIEFSGTQINYYFHCHRQLWLFSHNIRCEQKSDTVFQGKMIHEQSYEREHKEIELDNIKLDFLDVRNGVLHEIKKSDSFAHAHEWQVLYYLYYLKNKGVTGFIGEINYPVQKKIVKVILTSEKENKMKNILNDIQAIIRRPIPPQITVKKTVCRKCSYFEFCQV